jgi:SAM-dependent methyltransferase
MSDNFLEYAQYYDLLYRDKDYQAEADYVANLIQKLDPEVRSILELGSGTGIHASLLADRGFEIHGIERSPEMLTRSILLTNRSNSQSGRLSFSHGDIREIRLDKTFDAVIALFHVISYQTTNEDVTAAFATARQHMKSGGLFIFDVWYGPAVLTARPSVRIKRREDVCLSITRLAEPVLHVNENLVDVNYQVFVTKLATQDIQTLKETHAMRYFFKPEIERIAEQAGFNLIYAEEWLTGAPISDATWGACFVLRTQ